MMPLATPRLVYIDLGTNWGDTLDMFRWLADEPYRNRSNWEVFGFEASPRMQHHVERLMQWKNGFLHERPISCMPAAGSTHDLYPFAASVGCHRDFAPKMNSCMSSVLREVRRALPLDPHLCEASVVRERLLVAKQPLDATAVAPRYTLVPAAVGGKDGVIEDAAFNLSLIHI